MPSKKAPAYYNNWRSVPCARCGETYHLCQMEAHHVDPTIEHKKVRGSVSKIKNLEAMMAELELCIPVCKNCHALIHWELRNS
jgi:hypothetical protein